MKPAAALCLLVVFFAACGSDRVEEIEAETKKIESERVQISVVTSAQAEADAAEKQLAATKKELDLLRAETQRLVEQKQGLEASIAKEGDLAAQAASQTQTVAQQTAEELAEIDKKSQEIAVRRARALLVRNQAAVFAREIRPGDPPWATVRRVKSVDEFLAKVASEYPDDPVVADLAGQVDPGTGDPAQAGALAAEKAAQAGALAAEKAARLRDRFTRVYELDAPEVAAGVKEPTAH